MHGRRCDIDDTQRQQTIGELGGVTHCRDAAHRHSNQNKFVPPKKLDQLTRVLEHQVEGVRHSSALRSSTRYRRDLADLGQPGDSDPVATMQPYPTCATVSERRATTTRLADAYFPSRDSAGAVHLTLTKWLDGTTNSRG